MHIGPARLLEDNAITTNYDSKKRLCGRFPGLDWDDNKKIEKAVANTEDNENIAKDPWEKNKKLKKEKMCKKCLSKAKKKA